MVKYGDIKRRWRNVFNSWFLGQIPAVGGLNEPDLGSWKGAHDQIFSNKNLEILRKFRTT